MSESDWIVGFHAVHGALEGKRPVECLWLQRGRRDRRVGQLRRLAEISATVVRWVPRQRLDEVAAGQPHNGCAARTSPVRLLPLEELVAAPVVEQARLLLIDGVEDPHNLGAAIRSAAAFSVGGVVVAGPSAPPLGGTVARAAAGMLDRVAITRVNVAGDALAFLRRSGYWAVGADTGGALLSDTTSVDRWVLCVGAEAGGLRAKTRSQIDELVRIPIADEVDSLNLSVATGILLYHLCRVWPQKR